MQDFLINNDSIIDFGFRDQKNVPLHEHEDPELIYVLDGSVDFILEGDMFSLRQDDIVIINSNIRHGYKANSNVLVGFIQINSYELNRFTDLSQLEFRLNTKLNENIDIGKIREIIWQIFYQYRTKKEDQIFLNSLYFSLINQLIISCTVLVKNKNTGSIQKADINRKRKIINYLNMNYKNQVTLDDLSRKVFMSSTYLSKYIKSKIGKNFTDILNEIRMEHTLGELANSKKSITHTAMENGFPSSSAFNRIVKNVYGVTPKEYIKKNRNIDQNTASTKIDLDNMDGKIKNYFEKKGLQIQGDKKEDIKTISVNALESEEFPCTWNRIINIGPISELIQADIQKHVMLLKQELGFEYIRCWDLYSPELNLDIGSPDADYNFSKLDRIFDFIIAIGINPYLELGFKPLMFHKNTRNFIFMEERKILFHSKYEYGRFIKKLCSHYLERYGIKALEKFVFEQWQDPRLLETENCSAYFEWFEEAYNAIKQISANIKIGGTGFSRYSINKYSHLEFFCLWKERSIKPDFISIYSYPYQPEFIDEHIDTRQSIDESYMRNQVEIIRKSLETSGLGVNELHITEWNVSISSRNYINDSCFKAAYIIKNVFENNDKVDFLGYYLGTDLLSEYIDSKNLLNGGCGLITKNGIKKPSYYAFLFLNRMEKFLLGKNENCMITSDRKNNYVAVCHNYKNPGMKYYLIAEDKIQIEQLYHLFDDNENLSIHITINNVKNGLYYIKVYSLSRKNGSIQDELGYLKYLEHLDPADVEYLRSICVPRISLYTIETRNNTLELDVNLLPHEIQEIFVRHYEE